MSFVMGKKIEERGGFNFDREISRGEDESIWSRLKDVFESTYEVLHELARERGVKVEDIYASENIDREFWGDDYENLPQGMNYDVMVEGADVVRVCAIYEYLADKCLEKLYEPLDERKKDIKGDPVDEALEVINWYLDLIQAKMRRALHGLYRNSKDRKDSDDYNASAKVALIAIDRTVKGWKIMENYFPAFQKEIGHLFVILDQLETDIENSFPAARTFLRPGFEIPVK